MHRRAFLRLFVALLLAGCATTHETVTLPRVPAWQQPAGAATYSGAQVVAECQRLAPFAAVELSDAAFTPISHEWLEEAAAWSWEFCKAADISFTAESFDCDKFAAGFAFAANRAAGRAGVKAQPLLARISVTQAHAFGGVAAGGGHALNAFLSDRGLFVFEPQTRTLIPFEQYPNRETIFRIRIGG